MSGGERVRPVDRHERVGVVDLDEARVAELGRQPAAELDLEAAVLGRPSRRRPRPRRTRSCGATSSRIVGSAWRAKCAASRTISRSRSAGARPARERLGARALGQPAERDRQPPRGREAQRRDARRQRERERPSANSGLNIAGGKTSSASHGVSTSRATPSGRRVTSSCASAPPVSLATTVRSVSPSRAITSAIRSATPERRQHRAVGDRRRVRAERQRRHEAAASGQQLDDRVPQRAVHERAVEEEHRRAVAARVAQFHPRTLSGPNRPAATMGRREAGSHPGLDRVDRHPGARRHRARAGRVRGRRPVRRAPTTTTLIAQALEHGVTGSRSATRTPRRAPPRRGRGGEVLRGPEGLIALVAESGADLVLNAIVGSAGLGPTIVALTEGIDVALANKESLVVGGELVTALAEATGARLIPIDSEHTAIHHLLTGEPPGVVEKLIITASGGPFRGRNADLAGRHRRGGAQPPDVADGRQDHDRLGDADEQGPRGDGGPPPLRHAVRPASTSSCTRSRSSTRSCSSATARRRRTWATRTCGSRSATRCTTRTAPTCRSRRWT